mmetsp:Transcript_31765/g.91299  ORF Transcript_31765/g.91299 Transcript_31765/m.91299 type:complete len:266 (+) Transcript_31765:893-1690(+)
MAWAGNVTLFVLEAPRVLNTVHESVKNKNCTSCSTEDEERHQAECDDDLWPEDSLLRNSDAHRNVEHHDLVHEGGGFMHRLLPRYGRAEGEGHDLDTAEDQNQRRQDCLQEAQGSHLCVDLPGILTIHVPRVDTPIFATRYHGSSTCPVSGHTLACILHGFQANYLRTVSQCHEDLLPPRHYQKTRRVRRFKHQPFWTYGQEVPEHDPVRADYVHLNSKACGVACLIAVDHSAVPMVGCGWHRAITSRIVLCPGLLPNTQSLMLV